MKNLKLLFFLPIRLFFLLLPMTIFCQDVETQKQRKRSGDTLEVYHVLKSDKSIKHGIYQKFLGSILLEQQQYDHDKRVRFVQTVLLDGKEIQDTMDVPCMMLGGVESILQTLALNMRYPAAARTKNIQGTVMVSFIITSDREMKDIQVSESSHKIFDEDALRAVAFLQKKTWVPGVYKGKAVDVKWTLPLQFRIF